MLTRIASVVAVCLVLSGCAATYQAPEVNYDESAYTRTYDMPFDEAWQSLISHAASTFFAIENYEKDSGLMTLSFGASQPSRFIDGGFWKHSNLSGSFEGNYVDYLAQYHGGVLNGKMNIVLVKKSESKTQVTVNARYVFTCPPNTWAFDTGSSATVRVQGKAAGTSDTRTIVPTYLAETSVLEALE